MRFPAILTTLTLAFVAAFLAWIAAFKVVDSDFWWHVKAGQLMWETKGLIRIDPFSYVREGLPYLATHEWLAQLLLAASYALGGGTGVVTVRIFMTLLIAAVVSSVDRKNLWPNALLVGAAAIVMRQGLIERPQLFTNVFFALNLILCLRLLDLPHEATKARRTIYITLLIATIAWANVHGGAAILSPLLLGTVFSQHFVEAWRERRLRETKERRLLVKELLWCVLLALALFATPNLHHNVTYLWLLFTDQTKAFIEEWSAHSPLQYFSQFGPFLALSAIALIVTRRKIIAVSLLILALLILSRNASRHEVLFLITALACTFYELKWNDRWQRSIERIRERPLIALGTTALIGAVLVWLNAPYRSFLLRENLEGFGAFSPVEAAADFLEDNAIRGRMFNTYAAGGYLLFHDQKVFVDGRNVDYGYDFLEQVLRARYEPMVFKELEQEYAFTVAVIEHRPVDASTDAEFPFLNTDPTWSLVFLDDWAAVYLKHLPEHEEIIAAHHVNVLTPQMLDRGNVPAESAPERLSLLERDLKVAVRNDSRGIRALILLSKLLRARGALQEARIIAEEAAKRFPRRYEPYEVLASIAASEQRWRDAADLYERTLALSTHLNITPPYDLLATVFERAGETRKAEKFRRKAGAQSRE